MCEWFLFSVLLNSFSIPDTGSSSYVPVLSCKGQKQLENSNLHFWSLFSRTWMVASRSAYKKTEIAATCHVIEMNRDRSTLQCWPQKTLVSQTNLICCKTVHCMCAEEKLRRNRQFSL